MSAAPVGLGALLRGIKAELDARADLTQPPAHPSGSAIALFVVVDDDRTGGAITGDGREWAPDFYHAVALSLGEATWAAPEGAFPVPDDVDPGVLWQRQIEIVATVWAQHETAAARLLRAVVSAMHRRAAGAYRPVRDVKVAPQGQSVQGVMRRLVLRLDVGVGLDDDPFDGITRVRLTSAGVANTPGLRGDGAIDAFEETDG